MLLSPQKRNNRFLRWVLLILALPLSNAEAQQLLQPIVEVDATTLSEADQTLLQGVEESLTYFLTGIQPPEETRLLPKVPMRIVVRLVPRSDRGIDGTLVADLSFSAFRPIYGTERETPIALFIEEGVPLNPTTLEANMSGVGDMPRDPLLLTLHYYSYIALLYYYDTFDLNGGQPYLTHLDRHRLSYTTNQSGSNGVGSLEMRVSKEQYIEELRSSWGSLYRELLLLFYLEVVDVPIPQAEAEETLLVVLKKWDELLEGHHIPQLMRLLRDTSSGEVETLIPKVSKANREEIEVLAGRVFPDIRPES